MMTKPDTPTSEVIWECKIGGPVPGEMPDGWDAPMRRAVQAAFLALTGVEDEFTFSGRGQLTEMERAVVEKRSPTPPAASRAAPALPTPWKTVMDATGEPVQVWRAFQMRDYARAALASQEAAQPASPAPLTDEMRRVLVIAEAALADIGDADREPGDDVAWCEARAAEALPVVRAMLKTSAAALASPQVAPALTRQQIDAAQEAADHKHGVHTWGEAPGSWRETFANEIARAVATPVQVAPAQRNTMRAFEAWYCSDGNYEPEELDKLVGGACYANADTENMWQAWQGAFIRLATPVQVAPTGWKLVPINATAEMLEAAWAYHGTSAYQNTRRPDEETDAECYSAMLAAAPVAPQDDARDAAERESRAMTDDEIIEIVEDHVGMGHGAWDMVSNEDLVAGFRIALALSTPAAKTTEPTLPTQGEQSHD